MKKFISAVPFLIMAFMLGAFYSQHLKIVNLDMQVRDLKKQCDQEFESNYVLHIMAARQIKTLYNILLREQDPNILNKLAEERKKHED